LAALQYCLAKHFQNAFISLHFRLPRTALLSWAGFRSSALLPFVDLRWVSSFLDNYFSSQRVKRAANVLPFMGVGPTSKNPA